MLGLGDGTQLGLGCVSDDVRVSHFSGMKELHLCVNHNQYVRSREKKLHCG